MTTLQRELAQKEKSAGSFSTSLTSIIVTATISFRQERLNPNEVKSPAAGCHASNKDTKKNGLSKTKSGFVLYYLK